MYTIDEQGCTTSYSGNVPMLALPDTVNGIKVTSFKPQIFNKKGLYGIALSNGIEKIPDQAFKNSKLIIVYAANAKTVGDYAFSGCRNICSLEIPNVTSAGDNAFYLLSDDSLGVLNAPKLESAGKNALLNMKLQIAYLPKLKEMLNYIPGSINSRNKILYFYAPELKSVRPVKNIMLDATYLMWAYVPKLENRLIVNADSAFENFTGYLYIDNASGIPDTAFPSLKEYNFFSCADFNSFNYKSVYPKIIRNNVSETIGKDAFGKYSVERLEAGNLKTAESLPQTSGCILALPSTFESCTEDTRGRNYIVYGTAGSNAQKWTEENGHSFIPLSQETAVYAEIDPEYYGWGDITFDVIGYNKTYTWYGCKDKNRNGKTELCSEHYGKFSPLKYDEYPYYYCVCKIKDKEDTVTVSSSVCKNLNISSADYSKYNEAVEQAKALDRNEYKDFSAVDEALNKDVGGKSIAQQDEVDSQTQAILNAIKALRKNSPAKHRLRRALRHQHLTMRTTRQTPLSQRKQTVYTIPARAQRKQT